MMGLICYMLKEHASYEQFRFVMENLSPEMDMEMYGRLEMFSERLCQPFRNQKIFVLATADRHELSRLVFLREFLLNVPIVLILPDDDKITIEKGYSICPRFIGYLSEKFEDVEAVLTKMIELYAGLKNRKRR